jgi:hypothetical protein
MAGTDLTNKRVISVDPSDPTREAAFDPTHKAMLDIDVVHHTIHEGDAYSVCGISGSLGDGGTIILTIITPNTAKWFHTLFSASGIGKYYFRIYESATVNVAGSAKTAYNRNRNSANTSGGTFRQDDTFTDNGTLIFETYVSSGQRDGGPSSIRSEWMLKQNTTYQFKLESDEAANIVSYDLEWYEHTNG